MFEQPKSGGGFFKPADHQGHLVLFTAVKTSTRRYDELRKGDIDEFTVDFVDLDGDQALHTDVKVGHIGITNKLSVGSTNVLARVGTVDTGKGNPAWVLNNFQDADVARAQAWVEAQAKKSFAQPVVAAVPAATPVSTSGQSAVTGGMSQEQIALLMQQLGATPVAPKF
jgi:hypothetical protein